MVGKMESRIVVPGFELPIGLAFKMMNFDPKKPHTYDPNRYSSYIVAGEREARSERRSFATYHTIELWRNDATKYPHPIDYKTLLSCLGERSLEFFKENEFALLEERFNDIREKSSKPFDEYPDLKSLVRIF